MAAMDSSETPGPLQKNNRIKARFDTIAGRNYSQLGEIRSFRRRSCRKEAQNCPNSADWSRTLLSFSVHQPMARTAQKQPAAIIQQSG